MSEETNADLWRAVGKHEGRLDGADKRLDQQHEDIVKIQAALHEVKLGQAELKTFVLQCFAEQNSAFTSKLTELKSLIVAPKASPVSAVREFAQERPITTAGLSSSLGVMAYYFGVSMGWFPPPQP